MPKSKKKQEFKIKSNTIISNKYIHNKDDILSIYEIITQENKDIFSKLTENTLRNNVKNCMIIVFW